MRTIIEIPDNIVESLDRVRATESRSRASLIREAISGYLERKNASSAESAFGVWKEKPKDSLGYQDKLRQDWETGESSI